MASRPLIHGHRPPPHGRNRDLDALGGLGGSRRARRDPDVTSVCDIGHGSYRENIWAEIEICVADETFQHRALRRIESGVRVCHRIENVAKIFRVRNLLVILNHISKILQFDIIFQESR